MFAIVKCSQLGQIFVIPPAVHISRMRLTREGSCFLKSVWNTRWTKSCAVLPSTFVRRTPFLNPRSRHLDHRHKPVSVINGWFETSFQTANALQNKIYSRFGMTLKHKMSKLKIEDKRWKLFARGQPSDRPGTWNLRTDLGAAGRCAVVICHCEMLRNGNQQSWCVISFVSLSRKCWNQKPFCLQKKRETKNLKLAVAVDSF